MLHPRWDDPIRRRAEALLGGKLPDNDWQYILDEQYLEDEIDRRPKDEQSTVLAQEIRRLRRVGELPRSRRPRTDQYPHRSRRGWISADESTMAAAVSDAMYRRALANEEVQRFRTLAVEQVPEKTESEIRDAWAEGGGFLDSSVVRFAIAIADCYGWDAEDAAVFLLTGSTPLVEPMRASISIREFRDEHGADRPRSRARIVLEFDPWLSKETIVEVYEKLRRQLIGKGRKRPEFQELEVFRFVVARLQEDGAPMGNWSAIGRDWNEKHRDWNEKHPESAWKYSNPEDIKRTYLSVRQRLINAEYQITGSPPTASPAPGGNDRGTYIHMYVDPRERSPRETPAARREQGD